MALFTNSVDRRFQRFCTTGDPDALAFVFDATAARLLRVALWLVRNRADAEDVVQRTFVQAIALRARFDRDRRALPWLLGLLANQAQKVRRERDRRPPPPVRADDVVDPEVEVAARELTVAVRAAQRALPPQYRDVLTLHLEHGLEAGDIAAKLDRPAGTVRTQLVRALELLRRRLPDGFVAGTAAWRAAPARAVADLAVMRAAVIEQARTALGVAPALAAAAIAPGALLGKQLLAVGALVLAALGVIALLPDAATSVSRDAQFVTTASAPAADATGAAGVPDAASAASDRAVPERHLVATVDPGFGALRVHVTWQDGGSPAADVGVALIDPIAHSPSRCRRAVTDGHGVAAFAHVVMQRYWVVCSHDGSTYVDLAEDRVADIELVARRSGVAHGRVVGPDGNPVADAIVWSSIDQCRDEGFPATRTDAGGNFAVPVLGMHALGARKAGFEPSLLGAAQASELPNQFVELRLRRAGGNVRGRVVDSRGNPVRRARVLIGRTEGCVSQVGEEPRGEELLADDDGRFEANGIGPDPTDVRVLAAGFGPFHENVRVAVGEVRELSIVLIDGVTVSGTVTGDGDTPIEKASVWFGEVLDRQFGLQRTNTDAAGRFLLGDLPAGSVVLRAAWSSTDKDAPVHLRAEARLTLSAGGRTEWNPVLGKGAVIRGTVLDPDGQPARGLQVGFVEPPYMEPLRWVKTTVAGTFELTNVGERPVTVQVRDGDGLSRVLRDVAPGTVDLVVRIQAADLPSATLRLRVTDAQAHPVRALVRADGAGDSRMGAILVPSTDASTGAVELRLPPDVYSVHVMSEEHGARTLGTLELHPGQDLDLGTIAFEQPGSATLRVPDGRDETRLRLTRDAIAIAPQPLGRGTARFAQLQPGRYLVTLDDGSDAGTEFELKGGEQVGRVLAPSPAARVHFAVRDPAATRASWIDVEVRRADGSLAFAQRCRGSNAVECSATLRPGTYRAACRAADGRSAATAFEVASLAGGTAVEIALPPR